MKVLFVSSGNKNGKPSPIVYNQGESLKKNGVFIKYYTIIGKGYWGYILNIFKLRRYLMSNSFNLIHAHYSFSGFVAALSTKKPVVVSLMGSDVKSAGLFKFFIKFFNRYFWKACIVKSNDMKESLGIKNVHVIPNGVDFDKFRPISKEESILKTGFKTNKKHILFAADPKRIEKNFKLTEKACNLIQDIDFELHTLNNIPNEQMPYHYNASDVILLSSLWEGSPNVIKEAMACNKSIVATDVGDIKELINGLNGCYVTDFKPHNIANKITLSINNAKEVGGRERLKDLGLQEETIASKVKNIYDLSIS